MNVDMALIVTPKKMKKPVKPNTPSPAKVTEKKKYPAKGKPQSKPSIP